MFSYVGVVSWAAPAATLQLLRRHMGTKWSLTRIKQQRREVLPLYLLEIIRYQLSSGSRWLDVCHVFSCFCVDQDKVEVHCNINEVGSQYPVILTKQAWPKKNLVWQESVGDPDPGILCSDWVVNQNEG